METVSPGLDYYYSRGLDFLGLLDVVHEDAPELDESEAAIRALRLLAQTMATNEVRLTRLANLLEREAAEIEVEEDKDLIRLRLPTEVAEKLVEADLVWRVRDEGDEEGAAFYLQLIDVSD